ncbi:hypothetical protein [Salibacterium halotolerans]|uniref:Uncharacterized protein n=1 Tax=Salibacterium halotolerans TaxID=1884432 RepID=A0A1I5PPP2_9BACI|nr:hypothetical protein [Salibacterium halotolerans]SFP35536.1 hypothetical protein SAMN05518683_104176 [Salibacterium halotolerans]
MKRILRHSLIMWIPFALLCLGAGFAVELVEGSEVATTRYTGFQNIGTGFLLMIWFTGVLAYPVTFLPLTLLISRITNRRMIRIVTYAFISGLGGWWYFNGAYDPFIEQYGLNSMSAVVCVGAAGILYALLDHYLFNHPKAFRGEGE